MICKKCNVEMDVKSHKENRRGNESTEDSTVYYCPKCDHAESGN